MHRDSPFRLARAGRKGRGVFSTRSVAAGGLLFPFEGPRLRREQVADFARAIQVGPDLYLGPSGRIDDYVNHSCDPNAGVREREGATELFALRDIAAGEEITFDYSTAMTDEPELTCCTCGSPRCRGTIGGVTTLPRGVLRRLVALQAVPTWALAALNGRVRELGATGLRTRRRPADLTRSRPS